MKFLDQHIAELDIFLKNKGYDGFFLTSWGYPGRLAESLTAFCRAFIKGGRYGIKFPPNLTTYSYWGGEGKESVQCNFRLGYLDTKGFSITSVELESRNRYGFVDKQKEITVSSGSDIPTLQQAKAWGFEREIRKSDKKSKALKF